ncbi:hypothetical protein ACIG87_04830 [Micromonospora sp. NPDC051925]|uniref:hypothetical protein n=1 Tax=Micromonospora sp. NPDC051925 TaxID=3364288 RepID=UPI0037C51EF5
MAHFSIPRRLLAWSAPAALALAAAPAAPALAEPAGRHSTPLVAVEIPVDRDLDGDGVPDLVTVGGTAGLGSGVWSATGLTSRRTGAGTGRVGTPASNIGLRGNGVGGTNAPTEFDGAQVITGRFLGGDQQDFLAYYPSGPAAGDASIIRGAGDGTMLNPYYSGNQQTVVSDQLVDDNGNVPLQVVNAYGADGVGTEYPDLISVTGDATNGHRLVYHPSLPMPGGYLTTVALADATPTEGTDWQNWTIASTETANGVAMYLRNASTGDLFLWTGVTLVDNGDGTGSLTRTQYRVASNWNTATAITTISVADINADGIPDLWAVRPDATVRAYLVSGLSAGGPATVRAKGVQRLI